MVNTRYTLLSCLLVFFIPAAFSTDMDMMLGQENGGLKSMEAPFGNHMMKMYSPNDGDRMMTVKSMAGNTLFSATEHSMAGLFLSHDGMPDMGFTALMFDGKQEHMTHMLKDGDKWTTMEDSSQFLKKYLMDDSKQQTMTAETMTTESADTMGSMDFTYFTLDLATMESNSHLELGLQYTQDNYSMLLFKAKQDGHVFNEVKHGNHTLLTNQGDNLLSAAVKFTTAGNKMMVLMMLAYKNGSAKLTAMMHENGKWTDQDYMMLMLDDTNALYKSQFVFT